VPPRTSVPPGGFWRMTRPFGAEFGTSLRSPRRPAWPRRSCASCTVRPTTSGTLVLAGGGGLGAAGNLMTGAPARAAVM
jgi:hypothetical protein